MDPKNQPQFNSKTPISEVLKQEQAGFVPSTPKLNDVVAAIGNMQSGENNSVTIKPTPNTTSTTPTQTSEAAKQNEQTKIIKTYKSDAAEAIRMQQESVAKIAMAQEQQRREQGEEIGATAPKKRTGLLLMAIVLIALGAAAIPTVQFILNQKTKEVSVNAEKTIIPFDRQETLVLNNATRNDLTNAIDAFRAKTSATSTIKYIKVLEKIQDANKKTVTQQIAADIFAGLIGPNMPSALARSFDSDYMYGIENSDNSKSFILFKTSSYQQTFANMLRFETKMISDLSPIFNLDADAIDRPFTDKVVINKDVRAVTASDGTIIFLYGFLDNQTLVITTNTRTFEDINSRYIASHFVQ